METVTSALTELIEAVKLASPQVWEAATKAVAADAAIAYAWCLGLGVCGIILIILAGLTLMLGADDDAMAAFFFFLILLIVDSISFAMNLSKYYYCSMAPEWMAIQKLTEAAGLQ
jgi:hypothetical protein